MAGSADGACEAGSANVLEDVVKSGGETGECKSVVNPETEFDAGDTQQDGSENREGEMVMVNDQHVMSWKL